MEWISVKDKLPEIILNEKFEISQSKPVLMFFNDKEVHKGYLIHWFEDEFIPENFSFSYSYSGEQAEDVTHWMYYEDPK